MQLNMGAPSDLHAPHWATLPGHPLQNRVKDRHRRHSAEGAAGERKDSARHAEPRQPQCGWAFKRGEGYGDLFPDLL